MISAEIARGLEQFEYLDFFNLNPDWGELMHEGPYAVLLSGGLAVDRPTLRVYATHCRGARTANARPSTALALP